MARRNIVASKKISFSDLCLTRFLILENCALMQNLDIESRGISDYEE